MAKRKRLRGIPKRVKRSKFFYEVWSMPSNVHPSQYKGKPAIVTRSSEAAAVYAKEYAKKGRQVQVWRVDKDGNPDALQIDMPPFANPYRKSP